MASELSNQVYTAPQAPDYLGHYAELVRNIPDYGQKLAQAQIQQAQLEKAQQEYEFMKQKAKLFTELYPAFKQHQIDKMAAETATFPYRQALLAGQANYANARANMYSDPGGASTNPTGGVPRTVLPGSKPAAPANTAPVYPFAQQLLQPRPAFHVVPMPNAGAPVAPVAVVPDPIESPNAPAPITYSPPAANSDTAME
jgi:hypothetical protein